MDMIARSNGYSSDVQAYLHVGDRALRIGSVRAGELRLQEMCEVPPSTEATLEITVDGIARRTLVILTKGISVSNSVVEYI